MVPITNRPEKLEVGMVLHSFKDASDSNTLKNIETEGGKYSIVSEITEANGIYTVHFKTYDGSDDFDSGNSGDLDDILAAGDKLNFYQFPMNGLSPNSAKNLNFFRNGDGFSAATNVSKSVGTDAIGYTIEWVEEKTFRSEEEILPRNPAIWETKPKEGTADLDIYHEATGQIPIEVELTSENIEDFIPIGSLVEYENDPNVIPPGTIITDIDAEKEQIILSSIIKIKDTNWESVTYPANPILAL